MLILNVILVAATLAALTEGEVTYKISSGKVDNWQQAKEQCERDGWKLASAKTEIENEAVLKALGAGSTGFYFGLTKTGEAWTWSDGTPLGSWTNWFSEPNDGATCATIYNDDGKWYSGSHCGSKKYICQYTSAVENKGPSEGTRVTACNGDVNLVNGTIINGPSDDSPLVTVRWINGETGSYKYAEKCG